MSEKEFSVSFKGIKEIAFSYKLPVESVDDFDRKNIEFSLGFSISGEENSDIISLKIFIKYLYKLNKKQRDFFNLETETRFQFKGLENNTERIKIIKNAVFVDDELMKLLLDTSIGATRGMVSYKTEVFPIKLVLPLIDSSKLIELNQNKEEITKNKKASN